MSRGPRRGCHVGHGGGSSVLPGPGAEAGLVNPCLATRHRAQARAPGVRGPGLATCVSARVAGDPWRAVRVQRRVDEPSRARWRVPRRAAVRFGHKRREGCASVYVGPYTEVGPRRARRGTQACAPCGRRRSSVRTKNLQAADARSRAAAHCSGRARQDEDNSWPFCSIRDSEASKLLDTWEPRTVCQHSWKGNPKKLRRTHG